MKTYKILRIEFYTIVSLALAAGFLCGLVATTGFKMHQAMAEADNIAGVLAAREFRILDEQGNVGAYIQYVNGQVELITYEETERIKPKVQVIRAAITMPREK